jgi:hypothetical protein
MAAKYPSPGPTSFALLPWIAADQATLFLRSRRAFLILGPYFFDKSTDRDSSSESLCLDLSSEGFWHSDPDHRLTGFKSGLLFHCGHKQESRQVDSPCQAR